MKKIFILILLMTAVLVNAAESETFKMMTYNIKGHGMTAGRLKDIAAVINTAQPDFVAVQEVENRTALGAKYDNLKDLAQQTGMKYQFLKLVPSRIYGIGLLSKTEPLSVETKYFEPSPNQKYPENRGFIVAEFLDYYFVCTHYSLNADDRDTMTAWIIDFARRHKKTVFLAGDMNAKSTYRAVVSLKNAGFVIDNNLADLTYPADNPDSTIDMILQRSNFKGAKRYDVVKSEIVTVPGFEMDLVSDHLPVCVTYKPFNAGVENVAVDNLSACAANGGIQINGLVEESEVTVYDITGQIAGRYHVDTDGFIADFDKPAGIYLLYVKNSSQNMIIKFLFNF